VAKLWIGVDIGKTHHHVAAVDGDGRLVYSRRVANDESALLTVMAEVSTHGRPVCWAVDVTNGLSALLLTLLWRRQVQVRYVSGTVAFHMAAAFAGENKTDARDALVIAHTIRMRPDIPVLEPSDQLLAELTVLTGYRADLVGQRVATLFRLQELLTGISPALERAVDLNRKGPMMVLACWQTPAAIRHAGADRITALLRRGHVKNAVQVAEAMVAAARSRPSRCLDNAPPPWWSSRWPPRSWPSSSASPPSPTSSPTSLTSIPSPRSSGVCPAWEPCSPPNCSSTPPA
jgi:transposase